MIRIKLNWPVSLTVDYNIRFRHYAYMPADNNVRPLCVRIMVSTSCKDRIQVHVGSGTPTRTNELSPGSVAQTTCRQVMGNLVIKNLEESGQKQLRAKVDLLMKIMRTINRL
jgi:hypothetical protein